MHVLPWVGTAAPTINNLSQQNSIETRSTGRHQSIVRIDRKSKLNWGQFRKRETGIVQERLNRLEYV
jgi:hypothetical protein